MGRHQEPFDQGLWTAEDPGLLDQGQLVYIRNGVYRSGKQALQRISGRTAFGTVSATATGVVGLRDVQFDNGDQYLIAHAGSKLRYAPVGVTGTFTDLATVTAGTQLERIHYRNRFFLMNGATASGGNTNVVVYLSATGAGTAPSTRQHGMLPVLSTPSVTTASGVFSQTVTGYYEYWVTEVAKLSADGAEFAMESTFVGNPATVYVSSTAMVPQIPAPSPFANTITTHWRVYRSPKKDREADKKFPTGYMIAEVGTATGIVGDTQTTATATSYPGSFNSGGEFYADWNLPIRLSADDGSYASATVGAIGTLKSQGMYGFNFGGFSGAIKGITVELQAFCSTGAAGLSVTIGKNRTSAGGFPGDLATGGNVGSVLGIGGALNQLGAGNLNAVATKGAVVTATASPGQTITLGGSTDRWFPANSAGLVDADFGTRFMAVLNTGKLSGTPTVSVDYLKVTVTYAATIDSVIPFPTVVYTFGDISAQVGKNGPPPSSTTGDIYEDTLVVNDVSNPSVVRWSYPGDPEAFPGTYFLDLETPENDRVRCIKVVNNRCIVWLDNSTHRLNYLPSERDASFDRGKAVEPVTNQYGAVNPMCVCTFTIDGRSQMAAFVSHKGIHGTDGYSFEDYTAGLEWRDIISTTSTSTPICLVNDPEEQRLIFFYRNDGQGTETYLALELNYAADHLVEGRPKISGPWVARNYHSGSSTYASLESAWIAPRSNGTHSLYLGYGGSATAAGAGQVYIENGTTLPTDDPTLRYATREMYLAKFGGEWRADQLHFYTSGGTFNIAVQSKSRKTNDDNGLVSGASNSVTVSGRRLSRMQLRQAGEAISFHVTASAQVAQAHHFMLIDGQDFDLEDSGR